MICMTSDRSPVRRLSRTGRVASENNGWPPRKPAASEGYNPHSAGGGGILSSYRIISIAQKDSRHRCKTCSTLRRINLTSPTTILGKSVKIFVKKWRFIDVMFRNLGL